VHRALTARLFIAVDPPPAVSEQLAAWARTAAREMSRRSGAPPRVLDAELLHVTLCFLGNRSTEEIDPIAERLAECKAPTGELSLGAPLWLPPRHPRALAVELHDEQGRLTSLQRSVLTACGDPGERQTISARRQPARPTEHRHFRPHITVVRMRSGSAPRERALPPTPALSFVPGELVLYRSWLSPQGASYEAVATYPIG